MAHDGPLPLRFRLAILALVATQFLLLHGAVWNHRFDWDRSILWSYASIPPLVLIALLIRKNFRPIWLLVHSVEIACAKFGLTAAVLLGVLIATRNEPPPQRVTPRAPAAAPRPRRIRKASVDPKATGEITGRVVDEHGNPVAGAIVFVSRGLDAYGFAPPRTVVSIENDGLGFKPAVAVAQSGHPIAARSSNGKLHTLLLKNTAGDRVRNIPLLASGAASPLDTEDLEGLFSVQCAAHNARERSAHLGVFHHPFFTVVGSDARFEWRGVPVGSLVVSAFHPSRGETHQPVELVTGAKQAVTLTYK